MKKKITGFTFLFMLIHNMSFAQPNFYFTPGNPGIFTIYAPPINPSQNPKPYYTSFLEMGDGFYRKDTIYDNVFSKPFSYLYPLSSDSKQVLTLATYYDTTPRPPRNIAITNSINSSSNDPIQTNLLSGRKITIDPSVTTVVPGDTMAIAVTYKQPAISSPLNIKNIVAFFYNKSPEAGSIFNIINENTPPYSFKGMPVSPIRIHNGESVSAVQPDGLPTVVGNTLTTAGTGYTNALYFNFFQNGNDEREKNIFLSLAPKTNILGYTSGMSSNFKAILIQYNYKTKTITFQQDTLINFSIDLLARDPNGIVTLPRCSDYSRIISDSIFFQNDGNGIARDVEVTVYIPMGMQFPPQNLIAYRIVNRERIRFQRFVPGTTNRNTYRFNIPERKIIFRMDTINLANVHGDIRKRRGSIIFKTLVTQPQSCMYTTASIVFYNIDGSSNPPHTAWDLVRSNCIVPSTCPGPWIPSGHR